MSRWLALAIALTTAVAGTAHANTPDKPEPDRSIAIVSVQISGDAAPELRFQVQESIRRGLDAVGFYTVEREEVMIKLADAPELIDCTSTTCLQRIGEKVGVAQFIRAHVEATGAAYTIQLELLSPDVEGQVKRRLEDSCSVCTITELNALVSTTAKKLVSVQKKPVPVVIVTHPQGADLRIDDREVGAAPFKGEIEPGPHKISALLHGHLESEQTINVAGVDGLPARFEIIMTPTGAVDPPRNGHRRFRVWKWVTAGGAVAMLITGVALIAVDGDQTCSPNGSAECAERYDTMAPGIVSVGLGIGLGAVGGWMFRRDRKDVRSEARGHERVRGAIVPTTGGAIGNVSVRF